MTADEALKNVADYVQENRESGETDLRCILSHIKYLRNDIRKESFMFSELVMWLDKQVITSENIGEIRRSLFVPWDSFWNSVVRDETAARENKVKP